MAIIAQIIEMTSAIGDLKTELAVAKVQASGNQERANILLESKNMWMKRALRAEKELASTR